MSMKNLWLRQLVHGWVPFLGIWSVYDDNKKEKQKQITWGSALVGLLLATALYMS